MALAEAIASYSREKERHGRSSSVTYWKERIRDLRQEYITEWQRSGYPGQPEEQHYLPGIDER